MTPGTTAAGLCRDVFGVDHGGVSRRLSGEIAISAVELSQLVARMGIDADGVFPEDLTLPPDVLRAKLKDAHLGIYGRSASVRLYRAAQTFDGPRGRLTINRQQQRSSAFTATQGDPEPPWHILHAGEAVRIVCIGPTDGRLLLLDYDTDSEEVMLLIPAKAGGWPVATTGGRTEYPDPVLEPPLTVRPLSGNRQATALWLAAPFTEGIDQHPGMTRPAGADGPDGGPEFRALRSKAVEALRNALEDGTEGAVLATATVTYRVTEW